MRTTKIMTRTSEDDQILNFGCPSTTNFQIQFCYPGKDTDNTGGGGGGGGGGGEREGILKLKGKKN